MNAKASQPGLKHLRAVLIQIHDRFKSNADYSLEEDGLKKKNPHHLSIPNQTQTVLKPPEQNEVEKPGSTKVRIRGFSCFLVPDHRV